MIGEEGNDEGQTRKKQKSDRVEGEGEKRERCAK